MIANILEWLSLGSVFILLCTPLIMFIAFLFAIDDTLD